MSLCKLVDRIFDGITRIGTDACDLTNRNKENIAMADYMLENFSTLNTFNNALNLAINQPNILLQGSCKGGINSNYVDANNVLTFGQTTNMRERGLIQQRIFNSVPYLGKGPSNTSLENTLRISPNNLKLKSLDPSSEVTNYNLTYTPLIPSIEATVTNPANYIENIADENWIRGGIPCRLLTRENNS
jgi:hypothetical protein